MHPPVKFHWKSEKRNLRLSKWEIGIQISANRYMLAAWRSYVHSTSWPLLKSIRSAIFHLKSNRYLWALDIPEVPQIIIRSFSFAADCFWLLPQLPILSFLLHLLENCPLHQFLFPRGFVATSAFCYTCPRTLPQYRSWWVSRSLGLPILIEGFILTCVSMDEGLDECE